MSNTKRTKDAFVFTCIVFIVLCFIEELISTDICYWDVYLDGSMTTQDIKTTCNCFSAISPRFEDGYKFILKECLD